MNFFKFSGSARVDTCSADTVVPRITNRSTPASSTALWYCAVRWGDKRGRRDDAAVADLLDARADQFFLDRLGVDLAHPPHDVAFGQRRDLVEHRLRVVVAGPETFEVEHAETAEPADLDREVGRDDAVHGAGNDRRLEAVGVDLPRDRDLFGIAGASRRHDRDVVEAVGTTTRLAHADLDFSHREALL